MTSDERFAEVNGGIRLCYESFGDEDKPLVLLIMGLGTQMVAWRPELCREIAAHGFRVVRFDNRDSGRSTHVDAPPPTIAQLLLRDRRAASYRLTDMAADAAGLIEHLDPPGGAAHLVGASMGGMIAQTLAAHHPERVLSLVSIMSNTGARLSGQPAFTIYPLLLRRPPRDRDAFIEHGTRLFEKIGSPQLYRPGEDDNQRSITEQYDRGHDPKGSSRQLIAIVASGDRRADLARIDVPTLIIHGKADMLVRPSGGKATARAIKGSRLLLVDGMGHDLPRAMWKRIVNGILENARLARPATRAASSTASAPVPASASASVSAA